MYSCSFCGHTFSLDTLIDDAVRCFDCLRIGAYVSYEQFDASDDPSDSFYDMDDYWDEDGYGYDDELEYQNDFSNER